MSSLLLPLASLTHQLEFKLLLETSRTVVCPIGEERIRTLLQHEIDWNFVIRNAQHHRVTPLLYNTLSRVFAEAVPESAMAALRMRFHANAQHSLFLSQELLQVLDLFDQHRVRAISYKGPILAAWLYGNVSMRQFSDIDVIVPPTDVKRAKTLLISRGYRLREIQHKELSDTATSGKDLTLFNNGIILELHWGLTEESDPIKIPADVLWRNLQTLSIAGRTVKIQAPEDLLFILCIHGAKHRWEYLVWLCDIAELIRSHPNLNWQQAVDNATRLRGRRILLLGVTLAKDLLDAELPREVSDLIAKDRALRQLADQVKGWLKHDGPVALEPGENPRYYMKLRERRADRFRVALKQAKYYLTLTPRDKEVFSESAPLLLYFVRPFRLVWEYGFQPFLRFFKALFESWRG